MGKLIFLHSNNIYKFSFVFFIFFNSASSFSSSTVNFVPGFEGPLPFALETGYTGVDESEDVQLFYYFVKSESDPKKDPLILWLTGGPGCSSFTGFAFEIGPLKFNTDKKFPTLVLNPYSWTKVSNIIFLDLPVGTGFSYGRTSNASQSYDWQSVDQAYELLKKWLINHPEFLSNPVYICGDSFAGQIVPRIAQLISNGIEVQTKPHVNLKGYLLGNPVTQPEVINYQIPFAHGMGLISDELYESLQRNCQGDYINVDSHNLLCLQDLQAFTEITSGIDVNHILMPKCKFAKPHKLFNTRRSISEHIVDLFDPEISPCPDTRAIGYQLSHVWLNDDNVRKALGIREGTIGEWNRCDYNVPYMFKKRNVIPYHINLSTKGYRSLIYSGDHDFSIPYSATQAWIKSLNYSIVDDWRQWLVQGQVAGYTRSYTNKMTFMTIKGGGHTAPEYKPCECFAMFRRWLSFQDI